MRGWTAEDPAPLHVIERAMDYLRSQPFFYTLTPPALGAQPVDEFLFETREGFCEHYASAFTVMMRAAGIPARVVTGYQGGELNTLASYYIIRQSDAHAWTEVWLADEGWVRVDPVSAVAPERVALGSWRSALEGDRVPGSALGRIAWVRRALLAWDAAATYWNDWIVGYGPDVQRALLDALGLDGARRSDRWPKLLALSVGATLAASLALSLYLAWRQRRRTPLDSASRAFAGVRAAARKTRGRTARDRRSASRICGARATRLAASSRRDRRDHRGLSARALRAGLGSGGARGAQDAGRAVPARSRVSAATVHRPRAFRLRSRARASRKIESSATAPR